MILASLTVWIEIKLQNVRSVWKHLSVKACIIDDLSLSLLNCVPCVPACQRGLPASVVYVPAWFTCQRAYLPKAYLCAKSVSSSHFYVPMCQCMSQPTKRRANMPKNVPIFQTFLLWNAKGNFYILFLNKKSCIILDIILIHMCICIAHRNCIILHFRTSCHLKEKCVEFLLSKTFLLISFLFLYVTNN